MSRAAAADTGSPVSSISIACLRGTLRDSATIGVEQNSPMSTPGVANVAALRGDREIAACDQLASGGGGDALHGGDHRLRQLHDGLHHRAAGIHHLGKIGAPAIGIGAARGQFLHVVAGGKRRAVGCDHHRAHAGIVVNVFQRRMQFGDHGFGQAVARRGAIERQHGNGCRPSRAGESVLAATSRGRAGRSSKVSTWAGPAS